MKNGWILGLCLAATVAVQASAADITVDDKIQPYAKTEGVSGNLVSVGSDTLANLMTFWVEEFKKQYPNVNVSVESKGSGTAPPALIAGTSQLGPMSRQMKQNEIDDFEKKFGYKPSCVRVAVDALAVFVNKDNAIKGLTLAQVDAIFSKAHKRGYKEDITKWGQAGMEGDWAERPISLFGRNPASGTYGFFKEHTLKNGDYKDTVKTQPGSAAVVQGVTEDRFAIGYSGIGYITPGVRAVPLAEKEGAKFIEANAENAYSGDYPLARFLYIYFNKDPNKPLDPAVREFLKYVLSKDGQLITIKDGYFPVLSVTVGDDVKNVK